MSEEKHFAAWKGKLAGKIVLVSFPARPRTPPRCRSSASPTRRSANSTASRRPATTRIDASRGLKRRGFARKLDAFLKAEGALAWARMSRRSNGLLHGEGYNYKVGETPHLPGVEIAAEDYRRLARLAKVGPVSLELNNNVHFDDSDTRPTTSSPTSPAATRVQAT